MSVQNGKIDLQLLANVAGGGHQLRADAAASLARLSAAMDSAGYGPLELSPGRSGYRSLADQNVMINLGLTTMAPGKSEHGEGIAADFANLGGYTGARYLWLEAEGPAYGWSQPRWARRYGSLPEPWHTEYAAVSDTHTDQTPTTPAQEDDVNADQDARLTRIENAITAVVRRQGAQADVIVSIPSGNPAAPLDYWAVSPIAGKKRHLGAAADLAWLKAIGYRVIDNQAPFVIARFTQF